MQVSDKKHILDEYYVETPSVKTLLLLFFFIKG